MHHSLRFLDPETDCSCQHWRMIARPIPDGTLAGYRLVRKLAVGSRADVYLGASSTGTVALKVFAPTTSPEGVAVELDALGRLDSPHLVRLLDVSNSSGELPILVLERVRRGSVSALLTDRDSLECGEAVTVLAPIAALVGELHGAGVAHGKLGAGSVHLGSKGEPVLLGLGHCELFAAGGSMAAIDTEPAAAADRDALAAMALGVLASVRSGGATILELSRWIESAPRAYEFPVELAERLFACGEPLPVAFAEPRQIAPMVPARMALAAPLSVAEFASVPGPLSVPGPVSVPELVEGPPTALPLRSPLEWLPEILLDNPLEAAKKRAIKFARGVRPRFWVAVAAVAVGLILAVALIPSGGAPQAGRADPSQAVADSTAPATPSPTVAALPDDPLEASKILLVERATCVRDLSILCLDNVDEASSAAFASDAALIQKIQAGGEIPASNPSAGSDVALVERLGDTALMSVGSGGQPGAGTASILVIRSKIGWRIRDVLTGAQATAAPNG